MELIIGGLDPSLRNFGMAKSIYDTDTDKLLMTGIRLQSTEPESGKTVRKSSDDLRCASLLVASTQIWIKDCAVVFAEIPSGTQSARASFALGIAVGVLGSVGTVGGFSGRLIQVTPQDVKRLATGSKNAAKHEMIEWAMENWPHLKWPLKTRNPGKGKVDEGKAEHLADACAAINAGIQTDEFRSLVQVFKTVASSARQAENLSGVAI